MPDVNIVLTEQDQTNMRALLDTAIGASVPGTRMQTALAAAAVLQKIEMAVRNPGMAQQPAGNGGPQRSRPSRPLPDGIRQEGL